MHRWKLGQELFLCDQQKNHKPISLHQYLVISVSLFAPYGSSSTKTHRIMYTKPLKIAEIVGGMQLSWFYLYRAEYLVADCCWSRLKW